MSYPDVKYIFTKSETYLNRTVVKVVVRTWRLPIYTPVGFSQVSNFTEENTRETFVKKRGKQAILRPTLSNRRCPKIYRCFDRLIREKLRA